MRLQLLHNSITMAIVVTNPLYHLIGVWSIYDDGDIDRYGAIAILDRYYYIYFKYRDNR